MGSRGASETGSKTFKFSNARDQGEDKSHDLLPAYANTKIKTKSLEAAMEQFQKQFGHADHEWAYVVDDMGYVHKFVEGNAHSVNVHSNDRNTMILHNHPSGGAFSLADLQVVSGEGARGIVASGRKYDYIFEKGGHFKKKEFQNAVKRAKLKGSDYDDAVDRWLTQNQTKYGYKYRRKKNT